MAGDMGLLMRGLAKLSQAVIENQGAALRSGTGRQLTPAGPALWFLMHDKIPAS